MTSPARAAQLLIAETAKALRHDTIQDHYVGGREPERAFSGAALLDSLQLRYRDLPVELQEHVVGVCSEMLAMRAERLGEPNQGHPCE